MIIKHSVSTGNGIKVETLPGWVSDKTKVAEPQPEAEVKYEEENKVRGLTQDLGQIDEVQDFEGV